MAELGCLASMPLQKFFKSENPKEAQSNEVTKNVNLHSFDDDARGMGRALELVRSESSSLVGRRRMAS